MKDFFVSYTSVNQTWAEWIAWVLEENDYTVVIQAWDILPGSNFILEMQQATEESRRTIMVLSEDYLEASYTHPEWAAAFRLDPMGKERRLIPVRVAECEPKGMLGALVYIDLVGKDEVEAERLLLTALLDRTKPSNRPSFPSFPSAAERVMPQKVDFPGMTPNNLPRSGVVNFVGRKKKLTELHARLHQAERRSTAIRGMGGVGKTELALQYAQYHRDQGTYPGGICWLQAKEQDIGTKIVNFATDYLQLIVPDIDLPRQVQFCWRNWPGEGDVLIVIDDVSGKDDRKAYNIIKPYLPPQEPRFWILLTTRLQLGTSIRNFELDVLSKEASLSLLESLVGADRINLERDVAKALCDWLGYLPLGLELVGRFLVRKRSKTLVQLQRQLQESSMKAKALCYTQPDMTATHESAAAAFELSWQDLDAPVKELAYHLCLYGLAPIPWTWIEAVYKDIDPGELEEWRDEGLINHSLLTQVGNDTVRLHHLIREFIAHETTDIAPVAVEKCKRRVSNHLAEQARNIPESITREALSKSEELAPHLGEVSQNLTKYLDNEHFFYLYQGLGRYYEGQGLYDKAEEIYLEAKQKAESRFGYTHVNTVKIVVNLAAVYYEKGQYDDAEVLQRQLLLSIHNLDFDNLVRADILNGLALTLVAKKHDYREAKDLYDASLRLRLKQLGDEHPEVSDSLNNLGLLYDDQGSFDKAESLFLRALNVRIKAFGENHIRVADCQNSLASCYLNQGRYEEAQEIFLSVLGTYERLYGENHLGFATTLNNLANISLKKLEYDDAEVKLKRVISIQENILGKEHPYVCIAMSNLAFAYEGLKQFDEAEKTYKQTLKIQEKILGIDHRDTAITLNNLAKVYQLTNRYADAELAYLDSIRILEKFLDHNHPILNRVRQNLEQLSM